MNSLEAVGVILIAFALAKLAIAGAALRRLRAHHAGVPGATDPSAGHAKPWLFWVWFGWRIAAAALALTSGIWLLLR